MSNTLSSTRLLERLKGRKLNVQEIEALSASSKEKSLNVQKIQASDLFDALRKANEARQRKKEAREKLKAENPELYELTSLLRNHFRLIVQINRSAKKIEKVMREEYEEEL